MGGGGDSRNLYSIFEKKVALSNTFNRKSLVPLSHTYHRKTGCGSILDFLKVTKARFSLNGPALTHSSSDDHAARLVSKSRSIQDVLTGPLYLNDSFPSLFYCEIPTIL